MARILFSYTDQPLLNPFLWKGEYCFPFIINGITYHWEIGTDGAALIIHAHDMTESLDMVRSISPDVDGITLLIENRENRIQSHVHIAFSELGKGLWSFEQIDDVELGELDGLTLGEIEIQVANWSEIRSSISCVLSRRALSLKSAGVLLDSNIEIPIGKAVFLGTLREAFGLVGISSIHEANIGELDEMSIGDIDDMLSTFRILGNVPASIVKGIHVHHRMNTRLCVTESISKVVVYSEETSMQICTSMENIILSK